MFGLYTSSFVLTTNAKTTADSGIVTALTPTATTVACKWMEVTQASLKILEKNGLLGELQAGDAKAIIKNSAIDWNAAVKMENKIVKGTVTYRIIDATSLPRGWTSLSLKKQEG